MVNERRSILKRIFSSGQQPGQSEQLNKALWISNVFGVTLGLVIAPYSIVFYVLGAKLLGVMCVPISIYYLMIPFLNRMGLINFSRVSFVAVAHIVIFYFAISLGARANIHFLFGLTIFYGIFFYTTKERVKRTAALLLAVGSAAFFFVHEYLWHSVAFELGDDTYKIISGLLLFTTMGLLYVVSFYFHYSTVQADKKLARHLDELEALTLEKSAGVSKGDALQRSILESIEDGVFVVSRGGKVSHFNKNFQRLWSLAEEDIAPRRQEEILERMSSRLLDPAQFKRLLREIEESDDVVEDDLYFTDGTCLAMYSCPLIRAGNHEGRIWLFRDVTARRKLEETLLHSEKMASVGGMAAGVAHEINNPLAGIIQNAQVIQNRILGDLDKSRDVAREMEIDYDKIVGFLKARNVDKLLSNVMGAAYRASEIVGNMLSFARKGTDHADWHSIGKVLDDSLSLAKADYDLSRNYDFKRVEIRKRYQEGLPALKCYKSKLQQVFLNILINGAQAMQANNVSKPRILIEATKRDSVIVVKITNWGSTISEAVKKRIFEPFFTTKGVGEGTGLGLSVSYFIVTEDHRGRIYVDDSFDDATCFAIELPIDFSAMDNN